MKLPDEIELKITKDYFFYKERFTTVVPERVKLTKIAMDNIMTGFIDIRSGKLLIDSGEDWISVSAENPEPMIVAILLGNIINEMKLPPGDVLWLIGAIVGAAAVVRQFDEKLTSNFEEAVKTEEGKKLLEEILKK